VLWWFILLAANFIVALGYAFFEMGADASNESVNKVKHKLPPPPGK
jgi:Tfp pilus assembly protein PilO